MIQPHAVRLAVQGLSSVSATLVEPLHGRTTGRVARLGQITRPIWQPYRVVVVRSGVQLRCS